MYYNVFQENIIGTIIYDNAATMSWSLFGYNIILKSYGFLTLKLFLWLFRHWKVLFQNMCNWANKSIQIFKVSRQTFFIQAVCLFQFILYCKLFAWMNIIVAYLTSKLYSFSSKLQFLSYLRWWIEPKNDFSRISLR